MIQDCSDYYNTQRNLGVVALMKSTGWHSLHKKSAKCISHALGSKNLILFHCTLDGVRFILAMKDVLHFLDMKCCGTAEAVHYG